MTLTVLFFGISTDLAGLNSINIDIEENTSVKSFKTLLKKTYPALSQLNSYAIAVNETYAGDDIVLNENDIIAIIPPVSGG